MQHHTLEGLRDLYHPNQKISQAMQIIARWVYADMLTVGPSPFFIGRLNWTVAVPDVRWLVGLALNRSVPQRFGPPSLCICDQRAAPCHLTIPLLTLSSLLYMVTQFFFISFANSFSAVSTRHNLWYLDRGKMN